MKEDELAQDPVEFERNVADAYRTLGADVQHNAIVAGSQVDVLVQEHTGSGSQISRIVECKAYKAPVGVPTIRAFAGLIDLLRLRGLVDVATVVSLNGFSNMARQAAAELNIELLEYRDLEQKLRRSTPQAQSSR